MLDTLKELPPFLIPSWPWLPVGRPSGNFLPKGACSVSGTSLWTKHMESPPHCSPMLSICLLCCQLVHLRESRPASGCYPLWLRRGSLGFFFELGQGSPTGWFDLSHPSK